MNVTINFDNFNGGMEEGIRVYRDIAPISDAALPAPLVTLPSGSKQYLDATAVRGTKYYYRFGVFQGTDELISPNKAVLAVAPNDTGPGPQTLIAGDWDFGYFGYCKSADFISYGTLAGLIGLTAGTVLTDYGWNKVAYKGKVLYVARGPARWQLSYNSLYLAGAVFGTNDNGAVVPLNQAPTNQYKPATVAEYTVIPRMLKGTPAGSSLPASRYDPPAIAPASNEFDDIMGAFLNAPRWTTDTQYGLFGHIDDVAFATHGYHIVEWTQSQAGWAPAVAICRGVRPSGNQAIRTATITQLDPTISQTTHGYPVGGTYNILTQWRPVLELVM